MKNACLTLAVVVVSVLLIGLPASAQTAQQQRSGQTSDPFITRAMQMNQAEIDLGKMAQSKTQNPRVKEYADMMVLDHSQAQEKLRGTSGASQGQVQLSKEQQQLSDKLSRLDGQQFDKEYMAAMVKDHRQAVQIFQKEAGTGTSGTTQRQKPAGANSNDASIAQEMLPTLQKHLSEAEQISRSIGSTANPTR